MEWVKLRSIWGAGVEHLTPEEAGNFIQAVFAYIRHGEEYQGSAGREEPLVYQALEMLREDMEAYEAEQGPNGKKQIKSDKCRSAANARWTREKVADACERISEDADSCERICENADASKRMIPPCELMR